MEKDFYGLQKQIWRLIRTQRKEVNELVETNHITNEKWIYYLSELFRADNTETELSIPEIVINEVIQIGTSDINAAFQKLKNKKARGRMVSHTVASILRKS